MSINPIYQQSSLEKEIRSEQAATTLSTDSSLAEKINQELAKLKKLSDEVLIKRENALPDSFIQKFRNEYQNSPVDQKEEILTTWVRLFPKPTRNFFMENIANDTWSQERMALQVNSKIDKKNL